MQQPFDRRYEQLRSLQPGTIHDSFELLFHASPAAKIVVRLADGKAIQLNEEFLNLMHFDSLRSLDEVDSLAGLFVDPDEWTEIEEQLRRQVVVRYQEVLLRTPAGRLVELIGSFGVIDFEGEQCIIASFIDVTSRRHAERELKATLDKERRAKEELVEANRRLRFLENAGVLLSASLDYEHQLKELARIAVPGIADWCAVDVLDDDGVAQRLAVVHSDPEKVALAYQLSTDFPPDPRSKIGIYDVIWSGLPRLFPKYDEQARAISTKNERHRKLLEEIGIHSLIIAPLRTTSRAIGALVLATSTSARIFGEHDLTLAEDLARRASLTIENARLHGQSVRLNQVLEDRVRERTAELEASNRELEAFSYSVSHDLRAPLRHVEGFSELLAGSLGDTLDDKPARYLQNIQSATRKMGILIDDLLSLSRVGRTELKTRSVDPRELIDQVVENLDHRIEGRLVDWSISQLPTVQADPQLLRLVFQNLLENALKFSSVRDHSAITISADLTDDTVRFRVEDNGVGFDMRYVDKLFGVFQRLHSENEFEGTGIGLATTKRIIERHGGCIDAHATVGEGAVFTFTLPHGDG